MKLEAVCNTCRRRFLLTEILPPPEGTGGRCPFCGAHFGRHYVAALPDLVRSVEAAADTFAALFNAASTSPSVRRLRAGLPFESSSALRANSTLLCAAEGPSSHVILSFFRAEFGF